MIQPLKKENSQTKKQIITRLKIEIKKTQTKRQMGNKELIKKEETIMKNIKIY
tara:strand:+ start:120 stop:278 length:159 start_codon:yes stop_codon:yes gene_type:complete